MTPDLATRVTQNLQSRYARLRRGCWRLLRANATLRGQLALTEATGTMTLRVSVDLAAELRERNARIAELEAQQAAASQPVERVPDGWYDGDRCRYNLIEDGKLLACFPAFQPKDHPDIIRLPDGWVLMRPLEGGESDDTP